MNNQKGYMIPLVLVIIVVIAIGIGIYLHSKNNATSVANTQEENTATSNNVTSAAKIFLEQMKKDLSIQYEIENNIGGYQELIGYKLDLPRSLYDKSHDYLVSKIGPADVTYSSDRSEGYPNKDLLCIKIGLGAGQTSTDLPYVWCTDRTKIDYINIVTDQVTSFNNEERSFVAKLWGVNVKIQLPVQVQILNDKGQYVQGSFSDFEAMVKKLPSSTFIVHGEWQNGVFNVNTVEWLLG